MPEKIFWRFYESNDSRLSGYHCANTSRVWRQLIGKLMWLSELGHEEVKVTAKIATF